MVKEANSEKGSSPASRGGAGVYIEGELGAFYLLAMLAGTEPRGLPGVKLSRVRFQGVDQGYALDDLILEGSGPAGESLMEIQSKRDVSFSPKDAVFAEVAGQVARTSSRGVPEERHMLAVATQRQSKAISGPYQDVLIWARAAGTSGEFFSRIAAKGVASDQMRSFVSAFRANLVAAGIADEDDLIWGFLRRFAILVFDFESTAPLARTHGLALARQVLADEDVTRAESLWSELIEVSVSIAKVGGAIDREELRAKLVGRSFRLAGDRDYRAARALLAEQASHTLIGIGTTVGGVTLMRHAAVDALNAALEDNRFVELQGGPGVGKSGVLKLVAERVGRESVLIVLEQASTPPGGWAAFAQRHGIPGTAREFFNDLAASGGGLVVIDGLEMFADPGTQLTVNQVLREAAAVPGFAVIATARATEAGGVARWIHDDVIGAFGGVHPVTVGELTDDEVEVLSEETPELRAILAPGHPASSIARNLYRLSRLVKVQGSAEIRTEAELARRWWETADYSLGDPRAGQRIIAELARIALTGGSTLGVQENSDALTHLARSLTLTEVRRDQFAFYHDVLRDWAIGSLIHEDGERLAGVDLTVPASPRIARGIEFAGRLDLEGSDDCASWLRLLERLSPPGAHGSWRRNALLAIVRSEIAGDLLERCSAALLARGAALFVELVTTIAAVDTVSTAELYAKLEVKTDKPVPKALRTNTTGTGFWLLSWALAHQDEIPLQAIDAIVDLVEIDLQVILAVPGLGTATANMLFGWLRQLDVRDAAVTIPSDPALERMDSGTRRRMIGNLRAMALLLSAQAPEAASRYLLDIDDEHDSYKAKAVRQFSTVLAQVVPTELADVMANSLIEPRRQRESPYGVSGGRVFSHADSDYLPASPAQPPFFDLLVHAKEVGLGLVRRLVAAAIDAHSEGRDPGKNGYTVVFDDGPRFFPWKNTYFWSRDQAREYSAASGLKALEAWGHRRLDAGEPVDEVLADVLGPPGSSAAFLLVAVDLLLSHFPATRSAMVPFLANPELLATERGRSVHDRMDTGRFAMRDEPPGAVSLADLRGRPSRKAVLENALPRYINEDADSAKLRELLRAAVDGLGPYGERADFGDPAFMGRHALNLVTPGNWVEVEGGRTYRAPTDEEEHLRRLQERHASFARESNMDALIHLAADGGEHATAETARDAVEYAAGALPDGADADDPASISTRLIRTALLVARDGDDALLDAHEDWVRQVVRRALGEKADRYSGPNENLSYNRPALGALALLHLWRRRGLKSDRDELVAIAARLDRAAVPAFAAAVAMIAETDPRLLKAGMRAAFAGTVWRWHRYDEDEALQKVFEEKRDATTQAAVAAEIAWLEGAAEPAWPAFPDEKPMLRRPHRIRISKDDESEDDEGKDDEVAGDGSVLHVNSDAAAAWLQLLNDPEAKRLDWGGEVVSAYADWSGRVNGVRLPSDAEIDYSPSEWNAQFYALVAVVLLDADPAEFGLLVEQITSLPDRSFGDVAETLILAADVLYFNDASRSPVRPVELRERLAARTMALRRWRDNYAPGELSIDHETGGVVARMLLNTHNPFTGTRSYLVPAVADRLDPLLDSLRALQMGGPTTFVAMCTMNMLLVAPRSRHLDFVLAAVEAWFDRVPTDASLWVTAGVGGKVVEWFEAAKLQEPAILEPAHPYRSRIDSVIGQLVSVGIAEAHEIERQIEAAAVPSVQNSQS
ncbi:hypothetical protein [Sphingopyxis sp. EG6]|uniref:hypothetical protein n=1 Tax=Sphingopyxis sp. EG6 TaxID=1874061 RepID=UPI000DC63267|nr:hypothetical protein [Sphingopyxis sp. EG6]BBB10389.1 hypothetical protein SPYCW_3405 [Sphingopyxis sp. EG6]